MAWAAVNFDTGGNTPYASQVSKIILEGCPPIPGITALEILARNKFNQVKECNLLFSNLALENDDRYKYAFYEWINPITDKGKGAYPFRTGISSIRIALFDILETNN